MDVVIIGAGPLGGAVAHALAQRDVVREVLLVDPAGSVASGKALDILQSSSVERFAARVAGTNDLQAARAAHVLVMADSAAGDGGEWQGEPGLALLRQAIDSDRRPSIVCAGAAQRWLVDRGVRELGLPRDRIVGSAPAALASAIRALVALHTNTSPAEVWLSLTGLPPDRTVIGWSGATIGGQPVECVLTASEIARFDARARHLWPPGPYALAAAAAGVVAGFVAGSRRTWSCFMALDRELGARGGTIAVPIRFDRGRRARIELPSLSAHERVQLESARQAST